MERARLFAAGRRARAAAQRAQERLALLNEASERLCGTGSELEQLDSLARLLVEGFADFCAVLMPDDDGQLRRAVVRAVDPERERMARRLVGTALPLANDDDARLVAWRTGRVTRELVADITPYLGDVPADLAATMARTVGTSICLAAPLVARGEIIGVFNIWRNQGRPIIDAEDERFLADLGRRVGIAVDHGRLLAARDRVATRLQDTLLPFELPTVPGVELAPGYLAAQVAAEVGGDLYDAYRVDDGYALVIGDVAGPGGGAAGMTGLARATLRALTPELPVGAALSRLNALLAERAEASRFLSLAYLHLRPDAHGAAVSVWLAGHPPPWLVRVDGSIIELGVPGPVLGVYPEISTTEYRCRVGPGDLLLLYTDGLTGTLGPAGPTAGPTARAAGRGRLSELLRDLAGCPADAVALRIRQAVLDCRGPTSGDVAFLVARVTPPRPD
jgi:serine phosphatase RsbU (regulator of sigma subunit)